MPRVKTASGKRELIGVRLSESAKQAVDAARGDLSPSEWARGLIEAELARLGISSAPLDSLPPQIPAVNRSSRTRPRPRLRPGSGACIRVRGRLGDGARRAVT